MSKRKITSRSKRIRYVVEMHTPDTGWIVHRRCKTIGKALRALKHARSALRFPPGVRARFRAVEITTCRQEIVIRKS